MTTPSLDISGAIARITLQRPEAANKLAPEDITALRAHLREINAADGVRVLILQSAGKHFCSGHDLAELAANPRSGNGFGDMVDALAACRPVTIAAVQGGAFGGGADLALACDFRVGGPQSRVRVPPVQLGLHLYQSGLERFVSRLGLNMARRLLLAAEPLDAAAMLDCGFLTHFSNGPDITGAVDELAATLARMAPLALLGMKESLNQIACGRPDAALIAARVQRTILSEDLQEGIQALQQKREPVFTGR